VWESGFYPFLAGDAVKVLLATLLLPIGWTLRAYRYNRYVRAPACCVIVLQMGLTVSVPGRVHSSALPIHCNSFTLFLKEQFTVPEYLHPLLLNVMAIIVTSRAVLRWQVRQGCASCVGLGSGTAEGLKVQLGRRSSAFLLAAGMLKTHECTFVHPCNAQPFIVVTTCLAMVN
jgi:hypothetical protein